MEFLHSLTRNPVFDLQKDVHLERGDVLYSEGPDRAYLRLAGGRELLALWELTGPESGIALGAALGAPLPAASSDRPFSVLWIKDGQVAAHRSIGADAAMWLMETLAAENLLDYAAHLFGGHGVDQG